MRIAHFETGGVSGIAADEGSGWHGLTQRDRGFPGTLPELIARGADLLRAGRSLGQLRTPQWTMGKNFDGTGAFGPWLVTPDALPPAAHGLRIQGRLNGRVMHDTSTDRLIFNVPTLIELISVAISLEPGDVIITGTPGGVGAARKPPVFMQPGDVFEVEIEGMGVLSNPVQDE